MMVTYNDYLFLPNQLFRKISSQILILNSKFLFIDFEYKSAIDRNKFNHILHYFIYPE